MIVIRELNAEVGRDDDFIVLDNTDLAMKWEPDNQNSLTVIICNEDFFLQTFGIKWIWASLDRNMNKKNFIICTKINIITNIEISNRINIE